MTWVIFVAFGCLFATVVNSQEINSTQSEICSLPKQTGPCKAYFKKYYFDVAEGQCRSFIYGGCNGNENRFDSWEQCQQACVGKLSADQSVCLKVKCPKCTVCRVRKAPCPKAQFCEPFYCRPAPGPLCIGPIGPEQLPPTTPQPTNN